LECYEEQARLEATKSEEAKRFKAQLDLTQDRMTELVGLLKAGKHPVSRECDVLLDEPEKGLKTYRDVETGTAYKTVEMEAKDYERELDIIP